MLCSVFMIRMEVVALIIKNLEVKFLEEKLTLQAREDLKAQKLWSKSSRTSSHPEEAEALLDSKDNLRLWMIITHFPLTSTSFKRLCKTTC